MLLINSFDCFCSQDVANLPPHAGTIMWAPYCGQTLWIPRLILIATCGTMIRTNYATIAMHARLVYWGTSEKNGGKQISFWLWLWWYLYGSMSLPAVPSRMLKQKTSSAVTNRVGFDPMFPPSMSKLLTLATLLVIWLPFFPSLKESLSLLVYIISFCLLFGAWSNKH